MKEMVGPSKATTATVASVSGSTTRKVRRALALGIVDAFKCRGIWVFDLYAALVLTIALGLKESGLRWRKVPVALARARYAFPKDIEEWERRIVLSARGLDRLRRFLQFVGRDAFVVVKHGVTSGASRVEIASARDLRHLPSSRIQGVTTIISIKSSYARLRRVGNGSFVQSPPVSTPHRRPKAGH